jgi:hypothetical protein
MSACLEEKARQQASSPRRRCRAPRPPAAHDLSNPPLHPTPTPQRFVEDLTSVGKVDGAINFKTSTFSVTMAPNK